MRHRFLTAVLCGCVMSLAAGCGTYSAIETQSAGETKPEVETETETEINTSAAQETEAPDSYEELIEAARGYVAGENTTVPMEYDFSNVFLTPRSYERLGYLIEDIDGNGTEELIFGGNEVEPGSSWDGVIYDIYTVSDGALVHVLDGWERNRYFLCVNGMIANEGSSGAGNSNYVYFTFDGSKLNLVEAVIYDGMRDADHPWFYSTESEDDAGNAEPISEEQANEIMGKYAYDQLKFIPFVEEEAQSSAEG